LPDGWDGLRRARGCTPQSCAFREHFCEMQGLTTGVFGLSAQSTEYLRELRDRLDRPFQ
jgi:peroxiredoxin